MVSNSDEPVRWDVGMALRDVSLEILKHQQSGKVATPETLRRRRQSLHLAHRAHNALAWACEDLVEAGPVPERLEAMELALAHAMGQAAYCARRDRW